MTPDPQGTRPRIEGDREREILEAALAVLVEVGYDRLTMDAVAQRAKASKATLYRRWQGKAHLVVDALAATKPPTVAPDTGSLREDLLAAFCGAGGLTDDNGETFAAVITALARDAEFAAEFRARVIAPKLGGTRAIFERARGRGEIAAAVDLDLLAPALAGIVLHRLYVVGTPPDAETIAAVIDQIILPAAHCAHPAPTTHQKEDR